MLHATPTMRRAVVTWKTESFITFDHPSRLWNPVESKRLTFRATSHYFRTPFLPNVSKIYWSQSFERFSQLLGSHAKVACRNSALNKLLSFGRIEPSQEMRNRHFILFLSDPRWNRLGASRATAISIFTNASCHSDHATCRGDLKNWKLHNFWPSEPFVKPRRIQTTHLQGYLLLF